MSLFNRRAASPADPNATPLPQFNRANVTAALVIATLSAGALACVLYAPRWPIPCAIIGLFIAAFASVLHISLVTTNVIPATVRIVGEGVTVERIQPLLADSAPSVIITHEAETTVRASRKRSDNGQFQPETPPVVASQ